jgi:hypothetical protein
VFILLSDFVWPVRFVLAAFLVGLAAVLQLGLTLWTVLEPAERVARARLPVTAAVTLSDDRSAAIDAELASVRPQVLAQLKG